MNALHKQALDVPTLTALHAMLEDEFPDVVNIYLKRTPELLNALAVAFHDNNTAKAAEHAHTIKGSSSNLGLLRLVSFGGELEDVLNGQHTLQDYEQLYRALCDSYTEAEYLLRDYCQKHGLPCP